MSDTHLGPMEAFLEARRMSLAINDARTVLAFAREQDAKQAALVAALIHEVWRWHDHAPESCDGCARSVELLAAVRGEGVTQ